MSIIAAQTEQLLTFQTHSVGFPSLSQRVQLTIYGGESHFHVFVFQLAMQILCGNEFIARLQSIMNQFFCLVLRSTRPSANLRPSLMTSRAANP